MAGAALLTAAAVAAAVEPEVVEAVGVAVVSMLRA